jgi:hypothetical protein
VPARFAARFYRRRIGLAGDFGRLPGRQRNAAAPAAFSKLTALKAADAGGAADMDSDASAVATERGAGTRQAAEEPAP